MGRVCKVIGSCCVVVGLALSALSVGALLRDRDAYQRAALAAERNSGNIMYETELGKAQLHRAFEGVGAAIGALFALNGATLLVLGGVARRVSGATSGDPAPRP